MRSSNGNNLIRSRELISFHAASQIDKASIDLGNSESLLMGLAASAAYHFLKLRILKSSKSKIIILCGSGNNGGDGLALASLLIADPDRQLTINKIQTTNQLQIFAKLPMRSEASNFFLNRLLRSSIKVQPLTDFTTNHFGYTDLNNKYSNLIIIDSILGTGQQSPLSSELITILQCMKELKHQGASILSLDLPTGLFENEYTDFDENLQTTNPPLPNSIITFGFEKLAIALNSALSTVETHTAVCGFEPQAEESILNQQPFRFRRIMAESLDDSYFNQAILPLFRRQYNSNKYTAGYIWLIAGEQNMEGAALLAMNGFLKSGGGYVRLFHPHIESRDRFLNILPSVLYQDTLLFKEFCHKGKPPHAILIGPGISKETLAFIRDIIFDGLEHLTEKGIRIPILLDAAATQLAFDLRYPKELAATTILTPHSGEWSALGAPEISSVNQLHQAIQYLNNRANLLLKGPVTLFASPFNKECILFPWPESHLSVAGSGDLFAGILASVISRNPKIELIQLVTAAIILQHKSALTTMHPEQQLQQLSELLQ